MVYVFGNYEFDEGLYELRHNGEHVKIEPKIFDVLAYLIHHRHRVVTKAELLDTLWPKEFISESALVRCVVGARKAVQDNGVRQQIIKTLRGRGYRFIADVKEHGKSAVEDTALTSAPDVLDETEAIPDRVTEGVFVGRTREIKELTAALQDALAGRGSLMLLVGEPGIGKTCTASELAALASQRQALIFMGRCYKGEGAPPFWPWVQMISAYIRGRETADLMTMLGSGGANIAEVVPEIRQLLPGLPRPPALDPEQARFQCFNSITTFFKRAAARQPLVLILDDLHWADKPSLQLLQFLASEIRDTPLLLVGTYSDVGLGRKHPLAQTLGELAREGTGRRLRLRGLSQRDVLRFIERVTGFQPPEPLVAMVYRKTEGNPFFIKEIVRLLASDGRLDRTSQTDAWNVTIPQEVREVIDRRLAHLSETCNRILSIASVIGRVFHLDALEPLTTISSDRLLEALEEAIMAHIVDESTSTVGHYSFSHALIHETLYDELTTTRRARLHRQIGDLLEGLYETDPESHLAELAYHFFHASSKSAADKAIEYSTRAGERATALLAYEEACAHYGRALQALERQKPMDRSQCYDLLLALGDVQMKAGNEVLARKTLQHAAEFEKNITILNAQKRPARAGGPSEVRSDGTAPRLHGKTTHDDAAETSRHADRRQPRRHRNPSRRTTQPSSTTLPKRSRRHPERQP